MRLRELEAQFLKRIGDGSHQLEVPFADADGVMFLCPKCFAVSHGGVHSIICWFVGKVPDSEDPQPGRWNPSGTGLDDLTFVPPGSTSVLLTGGGCGAHFFVERGQIRMC